jgi:hypothetical protein
MPYSEKQVAGKITRTTEAWEEHAEDAKFAEMTLDQHASDAVPFVHRILRGLQSSPARRFFGASGAAYFCAAYSVGTCSLASFSNNRNAWLTDVESRNTCATSESRNTTLVPF